MSNNELGGEYMMNKILEKSKKLLTLILVAAIAIVTITTSTKAVTQTINIGDAQDLEAYIGAHFMMDKAYQDKKGWAKKCLLSISKMGYFSSDRAIIEYADKIWKLKK